MRRKITFVIVFAVIVTAITVAVAVAQSGQWEGQKWEYAYVAFVSVSEDTLRPQVSGVVFNGQGQTAEGSLWDFLNAVGQSGWEFVDTINGGLVFKRPIQ